MSTELTSRLSLADLIPLIQNGNLTALQKRDMVSAVKAVARVLEAELEQVPARTGDLRRRLEQVSPEAIGMSVARWRNIRSLLAKALALAAPVMPSRTVEPLLPAWETLAAAPWRQQWHWRSKSHCTESPWPCHEHTTQTARRA